MHTVYIKIYQDCQSVKSSNQWRNFEVRPVRSLLIYYMRVSFSFIFHYSATRYQSPRSPSRSRSPIKTKSFSPSERSRSGSPRKRFKRSHTPPRKRSRSPKKRSRSPKKRSHSPKYAQYAQYHEKCSSSPIKLQSAQKNTSSAPASVDCTTSPEDCISVTEKLCWAFMKADCAERWSTVSACFHEDVRVLNLESGAVITQGVKKLRDRYSKVIL